MTRHNFDTLVMVIIWLWLMSVVASFYSGTGYSKTTVKEITISERSKSCLEEGGEYVFHSSNGKIGNYEWCEISKKINY